MGIMNSRYRAPGLAQLEIIDKVARAAHLWIRHDRAVRRFSTPEPSGPVRHNLSAGLISGLCDALKLDRQCALYSAYAYALLDNESDQALAIAYVLLHPQIEAKCRTAYQAGRETADDLIAIL